jgi:RHS repeat-associated protein
MRLERRSPSSSAPAFGEATLDYDYRNQPIRVRYASGDEALYRYDALGRRIEKEVTLGSATTRTRYVLDGARELEERDPDRPDATNTLRRFLFGSGIDEVLAFDASGGGPPYQTRFLHESSIGSIVGLSDAAGVELEHYRYALNGAPVIESADYTPPALVAIRNLGPVLELDFSEPMHPEIPSGAITVGGASAAASLVIVTGAPASSFRTTYRIAASAAAGAPISLAGVSDLSGNELLGPAVFPAPAPAGPPASFGSIATGPTPRGVSAENPFLFQGRRYDPETGLYYYRARYYSPTTGRFLQNDPKGYVDGPNLYVALGGNPANLVDPRGTKRRPARVREVKQGDTLGKIAKRELGDSSRYKEIAEANPQLTDPNLIFPGNELQIPGDPIVLEPVKIKLEPDPIVLPPFVIQLEPDPIVLDPVVITPETGTATRAPDLGNVGLAGLDIAMEVASGVTKGGVAGIASAGCVAAGELTGHGDSTVVKRCGDANTALTVVAFAGGSLAGAVSLNLAIGYELGKTMVSAEKAKSRPDYCAAGARCEDPRNDPRSAASQCTGFPQTNEGMYETLKCLDQASDKPWGK